MLLLLLMAYHARILALRPHTCLASSMIPHLLALFAA